MLLKGSKSLFKSNEKPIRLITILLLFSLVVMPILSLIQIQPVSAQPTTVITPKWTRSGLGTNWEGGLVIGDVTGDGVEDIVYAGGGNDIIYVLNGNNGNTIATYTNNRISQYCQPQLYDINGDGVLDILVPLYYEPGLAAVRYDGDSSLQQMWVANIQRVPGEPTPSGSVMAKPVAGDIDGDGDLDIFLASQDVSPIGGYDGTIVRLTHTGSEVARNFAWRACSGGLSLADTDNDGIFEIYQGDRQMSYRDGGYGKGVKSFWAENLTERWNRLDFLSSSQAPVLVDVNNDGILDVLAGMYREMNILDSTNGGWIRRLSDPTMSVHYGFTVYDIDNDGHLELLCSDGDNDDDRYADVFDLVTGAQEAQLSLFNGDWKWAPVVADIDPTHAGMEIIVCPNGTTLETGYWRGAIMIYSSNYQLIQSISRFNGATIGSQLGYPIVQDTDNDGRLELVTHSSSGTIYVFDTSAQKPAQRIRSEVTYFSEKRTGAAVYEPAPWAPNYWTAPLVAPISPSDNALAVSVSTGQLSFRVREHQSQPLTYSVTTTPNIGSRSGSISSGTYNWNTITVPLSGLAYDTTYRWTVTLSDGSQVTTRTYTFRTQLAPNPGNHAPTQTTPSLTALGGTSPTSTFECSAQGTSDADNNQVTNIYRWTVNGNPITKLLLPFDTRGETSTTDYSGFGNNGAVKGATWTPNGKVGGAYSFDGKDDAIVVYDGGLGYYNNRSYTAYGNHEELGGLGNWNAVTVEAWIYLTENNHGTRFVAKTPSYALGFQSSATNPNLLTAAVWPYTGVISDDANRASVDRMRSINAPAGSALQLNRWYHVAFTYQSGVGLNLYLDGTLLASSSPADVAQLTGPLSPSRGEPLYIGRLVEPFAGMIDEVRLYSYAQPAGQIYNRYIESRNGQSSNSQFIPQGIATVGNNLACQVIPTDSWTEGTTRTSPSITIGSVQPTQYTLTVNTVGSGSVTKNPNIATYSSGTSVTLTAVPNAGWAFSGWSGDLTGSANPESITMNSNKAVTATFVEAQTYTLTVNTVGSGVVNLNPASGPYASGTVVQLTAVPNAGWTFSGWSGDLSGTTNPTTITMNSNKAVTATFTELPPSGYLFEDGFESGTFSAWTSTSGTSGETATIVAGSAYAGTYCAQFTTNANGAYEKTYAYETIETLLDEIYTQGYFRLSQNGIVDNSDRIKLVELRAGSTTIAAAGLWQSGNTLYWWMETRNAASYTETRTIPVSIDISNWFNLELKWLNDATIGGGSLWINGELIYQINNADTDNFGSCSQVRIGLAEVYNCGLTTSYLDNAIISENYIGTSPPQQQYALTIQTTTGGTTNPTPGTYQHNENAQVTVTAIPTSGYTLSHWLLDGTNMGATNPYYVTMDNNHILTTVFTETPTPTQYNLHVEVSGLGTTNATGDTLYETGTTVTIQATASPNWTFDHWTINGATDGSTNPLTLSMTENYNIVAVFTETPTTYLFEDDFETGTFDKWSSTTRTTGETTAIVTSPTYAGTYSAQFTSNGGLSYERAYATRSGLSLPEVYAQAQVYVSQSGIADNGDRFYFIQIMAGGNILAYAGWRQDSTGTLHWHLMIRDGTITVGTYSDNTPSLNQWYNVVLHWKADSTGGFGELYVDGVLVCTITDANTANFGNATNIRFGLPEIYNCTSTTAYIDNITIGDPQNNTLNTANDKQNVNAAKSPSGKLYVYIDDDTEILKSKYNPNSNSKNK